MVTLRIKNKTIMSFAFGIVLLIFSSSLALAYDTCSPPLPTGEWSCYRKPVPGWTPCVCTHTPGEPFCFWSSEPTCAPCDPSSICHVAKPCELCNMHQGVMHGQTCQKSVRYQRDHLKGLKISENALSLMTNLSTS